MKDKKDLVRSIIFLVLTCLTTAKVGADQELIMMGEQSLRWSEPLTLALGLIHGVPFMLSIMSILIAHEMGHYVVARYHRVDVTLPFFIPLPFGLLGTLGAIIAMPPSRDRNKLFDIGVAGPLSGLIVALPILAYGIYHSEIIEIKGPGLVEGNSFLYLAIKWVIKGSVLPGGGVDINLNPIAWAGWIGLLVTMINLMPIGQLDGGHIAFAYFGDRYQRASKRFHYGLLILGATVFLYLFFLHLSEQLPIAMAAMGSLTPAFSWFIWWLLLAVMKKLSGGRYHPKLDSEELSLTRRKLARGVFILFILLFTPMPLRLRLYAS